MSDTMTPSAAILTAAFGTSPAAPAPTAPTSTGPPVTPSPVEPHSHSSISPAEAAQLIGDIRAEVAQGRISAEEATRRFDALNVPTDERVLPTDQRDEEQRLIDDHFPPAKESEYQIRYTPPGQVAPPMSKELAQFDQSVRTWLSGAEFPRELGNSLITNIEKVAQATKHMSPDQLESYGMLQYERLERVYGAELEDKLNAAGRMVVELDKKTPGLKNLLRSRGLGDNAEIASLLIHQAERYWLRRKGR